MQRPFQAAAHRSFCNVFFDTICTTNFDFLLEYTLQETKRPHSIIVSEDRLPINTYEKTKLIKLHGDFKHPERMVATEHDYDTFLEKTKFWQHIFQISLLPKRYF